MSSNLKPWFRDDIARILIGIYFSSLVSGMQRDDNLQYRVGFAAALSSIAAAVGINPETIIQGDDLSLLRNRANQ